MPRKYINTYEEGVVRRMGGNSQSQNSSESVITTGAEQAFHREVESVAEEFSKKSSKMRESILHDLHLAQHGLPEQVSEIRNKLSKLGIVPKTWPTEFLQVLETRLKEIGLGQTGPSAKFNDVKKEFDDLFKGKKPEVH